MMKVRNKKKFKYHLEENISKLNFMKFSTIYKKEDDSCCHLSCLYRKQPCFSIHKTSDS